MKLLDRVRESCSRVSQSSRSVRIHPDGLIRFTDSLQGHSVNAPPPDPTRHLLDQGKDTLAFFLVLDTVNFGSGWFPHLHKPDGLSGYYTIAGALTRWCRQQGVPSPSTLESLSLKQCQQIFGQPDDQGPRTDLMTHFCRALNELGSLISNRYQGQWTGLLSDADGSTDRMVERLFTLPSYQDVATYDGQKVYFLKRAQIAVADLHLAFGGEGYGRFSDLDRLTLFADNLVPHVLRMGGVLEYEQALVHRIEQGELIEAGSSEEIEIRACAVTAVEQMVTHLQQKGHDVNAMALDGLLWHRGQDPVIKAHPRHRTRTLFY